MSKRIKCPPGYSRHHRKPKAYGGTWDKRNISVIPKQKHQAWHLLFGVLTPETIGRIVQEITEVYLDPSYEILVRRKENDCSIGESL